MRDANWKKTVGIGIRFYYKSSMILLAYYFIILVPTLLTKLKRSQVGLDSTQLAFEQLTNTCLQRKLPVESWRSTKRLAMEERGEKLRIFDINHGKAPTFAQITLSLTETNDNSNDGVHVVNWLVDGIKTKNDQWVFTAILILLRPYAS